MANPLIIAKPPPSACEVYMRAMQPKLLNAYVNMLSCPVLLACTEMPTSHASDRSASLSITQLECGIVFSVACERTIT